jgi:hypothetical protein
MGLVVRAPNPTDQSKSLRLLPLLSGYRNKDTQTVTFTTDYLKVLEKISQDGAGLDHLDSEDFEVVLPGKEISSAHLFDLVAYEHFGLGIKAQKESAMSGAKIAENEFANRYGA